MGLIARILEKVLADHAGDFLKVNREQLAASLMKGEVVLSNVELKLEVIRESLKFLPVTIKSAKVKTLRIKVPWQELSSKSVKINASGIELVLEPQTLGANSAGDTWADVLKRQRLAAAEALMQSMMEGEAERELRREDPNLPSPPLKEGEDDLDFEENISEDTPHRSSSTGVLKKNRMGLIQRVIARIVDNLSLTCNEIHIRYEDSGNRSCLGLKVEEFSLFTIDADSSEPSFVDRTVRPPPRCLKRRIRIKGMSLYWEHIPGFGRLASEPSVSIKGITSNGSLRREFVRPFGVTVTFSQHLVANPSYQLTIEARTDGKIAFTLGPELISELARLAERTMQHGELVTRNAIMKHRPLVSPKEDPFAWWRYAIRAVTTALRSHPDDEQQVRPKAVRSPRSGQIKQTSVWPNVSLLLQQRYKYIVLYKRKLIRADAKFLLRARKHAPGTVVPSGSAGGALSIKSYPSSASLASDNTRLGASVGGEGVTNSLLQDENVVLQRIGLMALKGQIETEEEEKIAEGMLHELELVLPFRLVMLYRVFAEAEYREEKIRLKRIHKSKKLPARALSAVIEGASSSRKLVLRKLGLRKSQTSLAPQQPGTKSEADAPKDDSSLDWSLNALERQSLYETLACDQSTSWMIENLKKEKRFGFEPSLEVAIVVPSLALQLLSNETDPLVEIRLNDLKAKFENHGSTVAMTNPRRQIIIPLWNADISLSTVELVDQRHELVAEMGAAKKLHVPGSLKTANHSDPLIHVQLGLSYLGNDQTKMRVSGEIRPTQLIVSLDLILGLLQVVDRVQSLNAAAPMTVSKLKSIRDRTRLGVQSTIAKLDIRLDWDAPSICIPGSRALGNGSTLVTSKDNKPTLPVLELDLGKLRIRSSKDETSMEVEMHGTRASLRGMEYDARKNWVLTAMSETLLERVDVDLRFNLELIKLNCELTPIAVRIDDQQLKVLLFVVLDALESGVPMLQTPRRRNVNIFKVNPISLGLKIPKIDVQIGVPLSSQLRRKRTGWGEKDIVDLDGLLPRLGWVKFRAVDFEIVAEKGKNSVALDLRSISIRDDVQKAGDYFRDILKVDGPIKVNAKYDGMVHIDIKGDVVSNWSPSSVDTILAFAVTFRGQALAIAGSSPMPKATSGESTVKLHLELPGTFRLMLNQETIGTRLGCIRIQNIRMITEAGRTVDLKIHNLSMYSLQWLPLSAVRGVQLFGSELDKELDRKGDLLDVKVDLLSKKVNFALRDGRFLWAHTLTKQFADYFADGFGGIIGRHFKPRTTLNPTAQPPALKMLVEGSLANMSLVCPALRFGEQYQYSPEATDEFYIFVHNAGMAVSVFDAAARRNAMNGMFREQDGGGCGSDATESHCAKPPSGSLVQQDPVVEIRIECAGLDMDAVKKPDPTKHQRTSLCRDLRGKLAWHIVEFTEEQAKTRAQCEPLTAREKARMGFDRENYGDGGIPQGEHPHGVSPQKFEMCVEIDPDARFELSPTDLHLMSLIILENILDHRRRVPRAPPPRLPLFEPGSQSNECNEGDDLLLGEDELLGGNFGEIAVKSSRYELPPHKMSREQLNFDAKHFGGEGPPPIVDLDLTLKMPKFTFTVVTPETRRKIMDLNCEGFEMALSEYYDRSQFVELSLDRVLVTAPSAVSSVPIMDIRPSSFLKNPAIIRARNASVEFGNILTDWHYERVSKPVYVFVTKFPQKDRRVEVGLERLDVNLDTGFIAKVLALSQEIEMKKAIRDTEDKKRLKLPGYLGGPRRARRALALELLVNRYSIRMGASHTGDTADYEEELLLKGSMHVILAQNRIGSTRAQVQLIAGGALRALSDDGAFITERDEGDRTWSEEGSTEDDSGGASEASVYRFWLEDVYTRKNPVKLGEIDSILRAFKDNEAELVRNVCMKYGEPPFEFNMWSSRLKNRSRRSSTASSPTLISRAKRPSGSLAQRDESMPRLSLAATQYTEATILEPFGIRVDLNATKTKADLVTLVEPVQVRLTNGHLLACTSLFKTYVDDLKPAAPRKESLNLAIASKPRPARFVRPSTPVSLVALLHGFELNLINDYGSSHSFPLARASLSGLAVKFVSEVNSQTKSNTSTVTVHVTAPIRTSSPLDSGIAAVRVDYFNPRLLAWESLLEPWEFEASIIDWKRLEFRSRRPLNLNLSYAFVDSFAYFVACRSARSKGQILPGSSHSEYYIVNETGLPISFYISGEGGSDSSLLKRLDSGQRAPLRPHTRSHSSSLSAKQGGSSGHAFYRDPREGLRVGEDEPVSETGTSASALSSFAPLPRPQISKNVHVSFIFFSNDESGSSAEFARLVRIPVDSFGTFVYALDRKSSKVTIHVSLEHGSKVIRVLSPVQVRNITSRPLTLLLTSVKDNTKAWALGPVTIDKTLFPIPLDKLWCELKIRPMTSAVKSDQVVSDSTGTLSRTELEAEAAGAISRTSDENGYGWSNPGMSLLELHKVVDRPIALMCDRSRTFAKAENKSKFYEQDSLRGGGAGYRFTGLLGVESFESSDDMHLRETYVITISPIVSIENRLPCPLLYRTIKREILVDPGQPADLPVTGGKIMMGDDSEVCHTALERTRRPRAGSAGEHKDAKSGTAKQPSPSKPPPPIETEEAPTYAAVLQDVWLNLSLPGFAWSVPFQPSADTRFQQSVVVAHASQPNAFVRMMLDCHQNPATGMFRVTVFVESWFINDASRFVSLQYREAGIAGEQLIYEMGTRFKDKSGQAATLLYELSQNLKMRTLMRSNNNQPSTPPGRGQESHQGPPLSMETPIKRVSDSSARGRSDSLTPTVKLGEGENQEVRLGEGSTVAKRNSDLGRVYVDEQDDDLDLGLFSEGRSVNIRFDFGGTSHWSNALNLDAIGAQSDAICDIEVVDEQARRRHVQGLLGMSVRVAPAMFRRSRVVTFSPRIVFVNNIRRRRKSSAIPLRSEEGAPLPLPEDDTVLLFSSSLSPSQNDTVLTCAVEHVGAMVLFDPASLKVAQGNENDTLHDQRAKRQDSEQSETPPRRTPWLRMGLRRNNEWWGWSGPFCCSDTGGEFAIKLRNDRLGDVIVLRCRSEERDACTVLSVEEESTIFPLYRIVSRTHEPIHYFQPVSDSSRGAVERLIQKGASRIFGWDEPNGPNRIVRLGFRGDALFHDVRIDELSAPQPLHLPLKPGRTVWISVRIRGTTKTVIISDRPPPRRLNQALSMNGNGSPHASETNLSATVDEARIKYVLRVELAQIGLSLIDRAPQELLYVSFTDVLFEYARSSLGSDPAGRSALASTASSARLAWPQVGIDEEDSDNDEMDTVAQTSATGEELVDALDISIRRVQIDNQLSDAQFPVFLGPSKSWFALDESARPLMMRLSVVRRLSNSDDAHRRAFDFFEFASLQILEMDLKVEDATLLLLGRFAWECAMSLRTEEELVLGKVETSMESAFARLRRWTTTISDTKNKASSARFNLSSWFVKRNTRSLEALAKSMEETLHASSPEQQEKRKIYFGLLHIFPLNINLSFRFTAQDPKALLSLSRFKVASNLRGDQVGLGDPASFDADYVAQSLPPALINIDNAKLRLLALVAPHVLADKKTLAKTVARHYSRQAITQVYRILGSSDLMGNPLGVVNDIGAGLNDFVSQPLIGLAKASPTEFVRGLGRGTFSLFRHLTLGSFDAISKLSGALGAGVALLSLDHRFVSERWNQLRLEHPHTATNGLSLGVQSLAKALYEGAGGVVIRPLRSVAEEGTMQAFARELGLGVIGVVVKPVVGLLDFASRASNGVIASVQSFDPEARLGWTQTPQRVRLPRAFKGLERRLDPYLEEDALVAYMIKLLEPSNSNSQHFDYSAHVALDGMLYLVAAGHKLLCIDGTLVMHSLMTNTSVATSAPPPEVLWQIPLGSVHNITASKEPEFPAVRLWIDKPTSFERSAKAKHTSNDTRRGSGSAGLLPGGAGDAKLIVLGGESPSKAIVVFHAESHLKARLVVRCIRPALTFVLDGDSNHARKSRPGSGGVSPNKTMHEGDVSAASTQPRPRRLGLALGPLPPPMRNLAGPSHVGGAGVILRILPDSPASRAGLQEGDIVTSCDGESLDMNNPLLTLKKAAAAVPPRPIKLNIRRAPRSTAITCVLDVE